MIKTKDFDYDLPKELIAQTPAENRTKSRLLRINYTTQTLSHHQFGDIVDFLQDTDILVLNNTKVIKARLIGHRASGGKVEIFLLTPQSNHQWTCLIKPAKRIQENEVITISPTMSCTLIKKHITEGHHLIDIHTEQPIYEAIEDNGIIPLPPYIKSSQSDEANAYQTNYQTVFAAKPGAVAAPTAGLHFTKDLLETLQNKGVTILYITLHVGIGTFQPVTADTLTDHVMHTEHYEISPATAASIKRAKENNQRIIAVGTTVTRALEAASVDECVGKTGPQSTNIFIYPGYAFKCIDGLITNFHLPQSTLLMLVSALAGTETIKKAYAAAIEHRYRFFSFGDAMLIEP